MLSSVVIKLQDKFTAVWCGIYSYKNLAVSLVNFLPSEISTHQEETGGCKELLAGQIYV
jgi:hypothetical protein